NALGRGPSLRGLRATLGLLLTFHGVPTADRLGERARRSKQVDRARVPLMWRSLRAGALVLAVLTLPVHAGAQAPPPQSPHVTRFSPEGVVKAVRQVSVRFSAPMVPLGDPRPAADVFEVTCPETGTARWVDSREWAYDFS